MNPEDFNDYEQAIRNAAVKVLKHLKKMRDAAEAIGDNRTVAACDSAAFDIAEEAKWHG